MAKYCSIFWSFFKVGTFTIGGGYAMIPLMRREIVERHAWMTEEDFLDGVALTQALPGVFAVNMAAHTGMKIRGLRGAVAAVVGNVLMPIIIILFLAIFLRSFSGNVWMEKMFSGLRPAVVALIAAPVFTLAHSAKVTYANCWIPLCTIALVCLGGLSPMAIVLAAVVGGVVYSRIRKNGH